MISHCCALWMAHLIATVVGAQPVDLCFHFQPLSFEHAVSLDLKLQTSLKQNYSVTGLFHLGLFALPKTLLSDSVLLPPLLLLLLLSFLTPRVWHWIFDKAESLV